MNVVTCALLVMSMAVGQRAPDGVMLVRDGKPVATVVIAENATAPIRAAAEALQDAARRMSGATLPIVSDAQDMMGPHLLVGQSRLTGAINDDLSEARLGFDGCVVRTEGDDVVFLGPRDAGAANGVYWFIEWKLGVHRFGLTDDSLVIPPRPTIGITPFSYAHRPSFDWRASWTSSIWPFKYPDGSRPRVVEENEARNQPQYLTLARRGGPELHGSHSLEVHVPRALFAEHPEYFPLINGERVPRGQLCLSNPDVLRLVVESVRSRYAPDAVAFATVSPNDEKGWCECESCRAMAEDPGARMMLFCNRVVEALEPTHPRVGACFLAYSYSDTMNPPIGLRAHRRVVPMIAPLGPCPVHDVATSDCPDARKLRAVYDGWRQVAERIVNYPYIYSHALTIPVPSVVAAEIKYFHKLGLMGVQREHMARGFGWEMSYWLEWQLLWDAEQDVTELRRVFLEGYYGAAAEPMRRIYERVEAAVSGAPIRHREAPGGAVKREPDDDYAINEQGGWGAYATCYTGLAEALLPLRGANRADIAEALRLAGSPAARAHVAREQLALEAMDCYCEAAVLFGRWRASGSEQDRERAIAATTEHVARLVEIGQERPLCALPLARELGKMQTELASE